MDVLEITFFTTACCTSMETHQSTRPASFQSTAIKHDKTQACNQQHKRTTRRQWEKTTSTKTLKKNTPNITQSRWNIVTAQSTPTSKRRSTRAGRPSTPKRIARTGLEGRPCASTTVNSMFNFLSAKLCCRHFSGKPHDVYKKHA